MPRSSPVPYLRLVDGPMEPAIASACQEDGEVLLGFISMSDLSGEEFTAILTRLRPSWVFDLRPCPYFNIRLFDRRAAFDLFRSLRATYHDVTGQLKIMDRKDASLNSGAIARYIAGALSKRPWRGPVIVLVDDGECLNHALRVLPSHLKSSAAWCAFELSAIVGDGTPELILRTSRGETQALQSKWIGNQGLASRV